MLNQQYKQIVRVRRALLAYFMVCAVLGLLVAAVGLSSHHAVNIENGGHVIIIPLMILFLIAAFPAAIFATVLGSGLAGENAQTLAWAWTKPISRTSYALGMMAVDVSAVITAYLIAILVLEMMPLMVYGLFKYVTYSSVDGGAFLRGLVFPIAVYCVLQAFTASLRRNAGLVIGLAWPIGLVLGGLRKTGLEHPFRDIVWLLNLINPWAYLAFQIDARDFAPVSPHIVQLMVQHGIALAIIAVVAVFAATFQWNRLEA